MNINVCERGLHVRESVLVDTFLCLIWGNKGAHSDGVSLQLGGYAAFKVTWGH